MTTSILFRRVEPDDAARPTQPEASEPAGSEPVEARQPQIAENAAAVDSHIEVASTATIEKEKQRAISLETSRGKENVPVIFSPLN